MLEHVKSHQPLTVGYLPTHRRGVFSLEAAKAQKVAIARKLAEMGVRFVDLEGVTDEGLLCDEAGARAAVDRFRAEGVDAVFAAHCDFGMEVPVGRVCKALGKPILLWGPRDEAPVPGVQRERDTQCGLFATGKLLRRLRLPFTYVVNCRLDDLPFERGVDAFVRAANVARCVRGARIGQVGTRPEPFTSTMCNEGELLERFDIQVVPVEVSDITHKAQAILDSQATAQEAQDIRAKVDASAVDDEGLRRVAAMRLVLAEWAAERRLDAIAIQCWPSLPGLLGICTCFANGELTDLGVPVACETDVNGAVTAVALQAAAMGDGAVFFADLTVRHPEDDNAELLWHCGPFPLSLAHPDCRPRIAGNYMNPAPQPPAVGMWRLKDGDITVGRFDGDEGQYRFFVGHARTCEGPATPGNYVWVRVGNWPLWEERLVCGPYIHHVAGVYGKLAPALCEGLKYVGVRPDLPDPTEEQVRAYMRGQCDL